MMIDQDNNEDEEQQQPQPQGSINYYEFFDEMTNYGKVFDDDLSKQVIKRESLTPSEQETRRAYKEKIESVHEYYDNCDDKDHPVAVTKEEVLQQRVVAPCLESGSVSSRAATNERRSRRINPTKIHPWTDFQEEVEKYRVNGNATRKMKRIFYTSLHNARTKSWNKADEQIRLLDNLWLTLEDAGIVHSIIDKSKIIKGDPDFIIKSNDDTISIICECKSTHNLLLPMTADECITAYNTAYAKTNEFEKAWSNVAHPIGQLLWYLIDNGHCYGALTSGTRTYFFKIEINPTDLDGKMQTNAVEPKASPNSTNKKIKVGETSGTPVSSGKAEFQNFGYDDGIKVYMSDAWFVGQANYLRAWAYVHNLRETMQPFKISPNWIYSTTKRGTPEERGAKSPGNDNMKDGSSSGNNNLEGDSSSPDEGRPPSEDKYGGGDFGNTCNIEYYYPIHQGAIAFAPYDDIIDVGVLGEGRNGGCFKVKWKGIEYAMKQFDIGKHGDKYFVKEICAYMILKDVWGILVPRPIFLSESYSGNIMFLGLQLGRESDSDDDYKKFQNVLQRINKEYGIHHNDAECGRNMIAITDNNGLERVVAIDFEDWDEVPVQLPVD